MAQERLDASSLEDVFKEITARKREHVLKGGFHCPEGDCVFVHLEDAPHYRERVDQLVTFYKALDDGRFIGLQIKGISKLKCDVVQVTATHGKAKPYLVEAVQLLFLTYAHQVNQRMIGQRECDRYLEAIGKLGAGTPVKLDPAMAGAA